MIGEKIYEKFTDRTDNMVNNAELIENQISVLKMTNEELTSLKNITDEQQAISYTVWKLFELQNTQKQILRAITHQTDKINPSWLKPEELTYQLQIIRQNLPENLDLIGGNEQENLIAAYQLAESKTLMANNTLKTMITLPLIEKSEFHCQEINAAVFKINEQYIKLKIAKPIIWFNDEVLYLQTNEDVEKCMNFNGKRYCEFTSPQNKINDAGNYCEWQLHQNKSASNCDFKKAEYDELWEKVNQNQWMFYLNQTTNINISCDHETVNIRLNGTGVITLQDTCTLQTSKSVIKATMEKTNNWQPSIRLHKIQWPGKINSLNEFKISDVINNLKTSQHISTKHLWQNIIISH